MAISQPEDGDGARGVARALGALLLLVAAWLVALALYMASMRALAWVMRLVTTTAAHRIK